MQVRARQTILPGPGEVLVRNRAFAVGFPDLLTVQGKYQRKPRLPFVPGSEFCGEILARGDDAELFRLGQQVMGTVMLGAYAELILVAEENCLALPADFNIYQGGSFLVAYKTAYVGLIERGKLCRGETLLVTGAAGGVGLAAIELGKQMGARVIAAASTADKLEVAKSYGADVLIDTTAASLHAQVKAVTDGCGADVIYDPVGGDAFDEALHCIAPFGRILVIGFASGRIPDAPVNLALLKQIAIVGVRAGEFGRLNPKGGQRVNQALFELASAGRLHPYVHRVYRFNDVVHALDAMQARTTIGRSVVAVADIE